MTMSRKGTWIIFNDYLMIWAKYSIKFNQRLSSDNFSNSGAFGKKQNFWKYVFLLQLVRNECHCHLVDRGQG